MSFYFTTSFLDLLKTGWTPGDVKVYLLPKAPTLLYGEDEPLLTTDAYVDIDNIETLVEKLGWGSTYVEGPSLEVTVDSGVGAPGRNVAEIDEEDRFVLPDDMLTTPVMAMAFAQDLGGPEDDEIMFVTDTAFTPTLLLHAEDGVVPAVDTTLEGKRVLFYWDDTGAGVPVKGIEGSFLIERAPIPFETARTQHIWVYPQRLNLIANPSFEQDTDFWRTSDTGSIATVAGAPPGAGNFCGRITGTSPLVLESDIFPLSYGRSRETGLTMQLQARGAGILKVGLVTWEADYRASAADWGHEPIPEGEITPSWILGGGGFTHIRTIRDFGEGVAGMLRLEFKPYDSSSTTGVFDVDQVCVEPGTMPDNFNDWPYFDGASQFGARGDFSWYGGTANAHASYSCWYNLRGPTFGRLFAWNVDVTPTTLTDTEAAKQGLAYQWVPAGTPVRGHLDVLYPEDPMWNEPRPLVPYTGPVLEYRTGATPDLQDISSPWA